MTESAPTTDQRLLYQEIRRLSWVRVGQFGLYCGLLFLGLGVIGALLLGTVRIFVPLGAVCLSGWITAVLAVFSEYRRARSELDKLAGLHGFSRDYILREMEKNPSLLALRESIFR
jgi:hypothetical protein